MQKSLLIVVTAVLLSACTRQDAANQIEKPQAETADSYAALTAAIQSGQAASCKITKTEDGSVMDYHIKADKVHVSGIASAETTENQYTAMLMDGEYMYTWDEKAKTGVKFPVPDPEVAAKANQQLPQVPDLTDQAARDKYVNDGYTVDCEISDVPDSTFIAPTDVTFTDMSGLMLNAQQLMEQTNTNAGAGISAEDQQQLQQQAEQMMQQYGQ